MSKRKKLISRLQSYAHNLELECSMALALPKTRMLSNDCLVSLAEELESLAKSIRKFVEGEVKV